MLIILRDTQKTKMVATENSLVEEVGIVILCFYYIFNWNGWVIHHELF